MKKIIGMFCVIVIFLIGESCYADEWIEYGPVDGVDLEYIWKLEFNDTVDESKIQQVVINNFLGNVELENTYVDKVAKIDALQPYLPGVNYVMDIYLSNHKKYKMKFKTTNKHFDEMLVHFIKVDNGQSILVQMPNNSNILINSANEIDSIDVSNYLKNLGIESLDALILTGKISNKTAKLPKAISPVSIKKIYYSDVDVTKKSLSYLDGFMIDNELEKVAYRQGSEIKFGTISLSVLLNKKVDSKFETVFLLSYDNMQYLITNNMSNEIEKELLENHIFSNIEVLSSSNFKDNIISKNFINSLKTKYAILQKSSKQETGGPSVELLDQLNNEFVQTYPVDIVGSTISRTDGERMQWMSKPWVASLSRGEKWNSKIVIEHIDRAADRVYVKNYTSKAIELSGWYILSRNGNEKYVFPDGFMLWPGQRMSIQSHIATGFKQKNVINWTNKDIWKDASQDIGELYDNRGNLRSSYPYSW